MSNYGMVDNMSLNKRVAELELQVSGLSCIVIELMRMHGFGLNGLECDVDGCEIHNPKNNEGVNDEKI